jgi:hypothetical protein
MKESTRCHAKRKQLMPEPQEQDPTVLRFERIEAAHEFLTGIVAGTAVTQQKLEESQLRTEFALTQIGEQMRKLAEAQTRTEVHMDQLAVKSAETQGKLDALIDMWNNWIVENGKNGKNGSPAPQPPPA